MQNAVSGMLCRVDIIRTDVSEERSSSFIKVTRIGELGTTLAVTSNRSTLRRTDSAVNIQITASWEVSPRIFVVRHRSLRHFILIYCAIYYINLTLPLTPIHFN
jgi:hypothetical protein